MKTALGPYAIVSELGRGGMGVVYKAYEPALQRYVAIKALAPALAHQPGLVERFLREARAMAAVSDPHVLPIYRIDEDADGPWFAMEWVDGENLAQVVARLGRLAEGQALDLVRQAAQGLAAAHARGLVHRDVKPANLLLGSNGVLKIADFGIARAQRDAQARLTGTGDVIGTPGYLSPEACLGQPIDARTDLFALGIVLFELLSGRLPFEADSPFRTMQQVVQAAAPDLASLGVDVHPATATLLATLLAKAPEDRPADAAALMARLEAHPLLLGPRVPLRATPAPAAAPTVLSPPPPSPAGPAEAAMPVSPAPEARRRAGPAAIGAVLAGGIALAALFGWITRPAAPDAGPAVATGTEAPSSAPPPAEPQAPVPAVGSAAETVAAASAPEAPTAAPAPAVSAATVADPAPAPTPAPSASPAEDAPTAGDALLDPWAAAPAAPDESTAPPADAAPAAGPVARYGEAWTGPGVVQVVLAEIPDADAAYVRITGINHPWDGRVLRLGHRPAPRDGRDYFLPFEGSDWVMIVKRKDFRSGRMQAWLYVPGLGDVGELAEAAEAARALDTAALRDGWTGRNPE